MMKSVLIPTFGLAVAIGLMAPSSAHAVVNLVMNGDFETFSKTSSAELVSTNNPNGATLSKWTNAGYGYIFTPNTADSSGAPNDEFGGTFKLWGPASGSANGLTPTSPTGGNYIGLDGAFESAPLQQSISGLTVGYAYTLSFWWAAAQQVGFGGVTQESWGVTFGGQTYNTTPVTTPDHGFSPWRQATFTFVPTSATQTLSFLAAGSPSGTPPISLLDGVVLVAAPEPATWAIMIVGLVGAGFLVRSRRQQKAGGLA